MKLKFNGFLVLLLVLIAQVTFAQERVVAGTVSDNSGMPLPGVSVLIKGTKSGTQTDFDGKFSIKASPNQTLLFSYIGMKSQEALASTSILNIRLKDDSVELEGVVVTALGVKRSEKSLTYASQSVKAKDLNITQDANIKTAIAGKVAGVQIVGQSGAKLGASGKIRLRGAISLTSDSDPLYIVDGVPVSDPNVIDMENVASVNVLKGPNATSLYGQRAEAGVIIITSKSGKGKKVEVSLISSTTFDKVAYLPNYQNEYGQGYGGESEWTNFDFASNPNYPAGWASLNGKKYIGTPDADASWGPKFDGSDYIPWYAWQPGTEYFGKTAKWEGQKNNIKNFYDTGVTKKQGISVSGGNETFSSRFSYTNLNQQGIIPNSDLNKHLLSFRIDANLTSKFTIGAGVNYTTQKTLGDFDDDYSNQTSGSFNSWFGRDLDVRKLKELRGLKTDNGYSASWNWAGPEVYANSLAGNDPTDQGGQKPVFWFNPYYWLDQYTNENSRNQLVADIHGDYKFSDHWSANFMVSRNQTENRGIFKVPFDVQYSSDLDAGNMKNINSFGRSSSTLIEDNYTTILNYKNNFGKFEVEALAGGQIRRNNNQSWAAQMDSGNITSGGLLIPDLYIYSNSKEQVVPSTSYTVKQVNSMFAKASVGYGGYAYLDASIRKDYSSALFNNANGYIYPSVGGSLIFSELAKYDWLSFGKVRFGWAQVGSDLAANLINPAFPTYNGSYNGYNGKPIMYNQSQLVDNQIKPAINSSTEFGVDLKFLNNRLGLSATYYNETRKDDIIPISVSAGSGYSTKLTNAGKSVRKGVELVLNATPVKTNDFDWTVAVNFAKNKTTIEELPDGLQSINAPGGSSAFTFVTVTHQLNGEWGQLLGAGFATDANNNKIIDENGLYVVQQNKYLGSVLPEFTGGFLNTITYKNLSLTALIDFQKGGKFFSLSEMWGTNGGLLDDTVGNNDLGNPKRDAVNGKVGGGVHVVGVDKAGAKFDEYVEAYDYYNQWYANRLAEPFVHDASYIKLRDVSLTYSIPGKWVKNVFESASVGIVGRNLWLISVSKENKHNWDPSEMSKTFGEDGGLPGTKSYGINLKVTF
ncbi:SusC/RagA family TonB-linked outer membrane protein [Flavobacterium sp. P4023]|uniref:SusC/RagA family TonB-linked outer membrane protein n=1 Tax=Flavobacterium flabelliforme TaxID=2816119 RepID=A0ABS5CS70_9FLAO|nr:SusC/RagA family TonB-linked outer membrane protein [Flavobacterium flabelliforme]MBP4141456.1 SusC/RagA family TonB-linked outer membrane protein [Flavobacterium flabelliforme]